MIDSKQVKKAHSIVIFGGNGDLSYRKLLPALSQLHAKGLLTEDFKVLGCSRAELSTDEFRKEASIAIGHNESHSNPDWHSKFLERLHFESVDASKLESFEKIKSHLNKKQLARCLFYVATPPNLFSSICEKLKQANLVNSNSRIIVEKPIGEDLQSSQIINENLVDVFDEKNIYRIDHYLGKSSVQNLIALRFANTFFEPLWNNQFIDHVQITVSESVGVGNRWSFYDNVGALRDMVQNHLLQLLSLIAMEPASHLSPESLQHEKVKIFRCLRPITEENIKECTVRGQYRGGANDGQLLPSYNSEGGEGCNSQTESFVALKTHIDNWRWAGVPFYLRTGKRLAQRYAEIVVQFKSVSHSIFGDSLNANQLIIRLQPTESIKLVLMNRKADLLDQTKLVSVPLNLDVQHEYKEAQIPSGYERLLHDALIGDSTLFMSRFEVEAAWRWTDTILSGWSDLNVPVDYYPAGSMGPSSSDHLMLKDGRKWFENSFEEPNKPNAQRNS